MTNERAYTYVLLRYRHDPLAGEFANVGVVLHQPSTGFLDAKVRHTLGRLSKMFPDLDGDTLKSVLRGLERAIERLAKREGSDLLTSLKDAGAFARRVMPDDDTSFVWGPVGSGLTTNPSDMLARLYDRFIARYDEPHMRHRDDAAVWRPVRDRLAELDLADRLEHKIIVSPVDRVEFQNAWKNGAWHCYQPLSFDLVNGENIREKARRWAGHLLALSEPDEPFKPYFFVGSPSNDSLEAAYRDAIEILQLGPNEPVVIEETRMDDLIHLIQGQLRTAERSSPDQKT